MRNFGKTRSTVRPNAVVIDDFSVWQHSNIIEVSENVGEENEFIGFEFDMVQFEKDEFILKQAQENQTLAQQITDAELALCELYEMMDTGE